MFLSFSKGSWREGPLALAPASAMTPQLAVWLGLARGLFLASPSARTLSVLIG